jgi:2'-hydroxyisoflavone reductase
MSTRRRFLVQTAAWAGGAVGLGVLGAAGSARGLTGGFGFAPFIPGERADKPLKVLILGGTGFLGPAVIDAAQARGHSVTIFNRGKREKYVGTRDHVEKLYGNRDPEKFADEEKKEGPKGLEELKGKTWDAVVDTSGYFPRMVTASAEALSSSVGHYVFISTLSVYKNNDQPNKDESDELAVMADPKVEEFGAQFENYGAGKALCEKAAEAAMPGRVTSLRAGYIVGPGDTTDRFTYWPVRFSRGGEVLVPGTAKDPVQIIDVRDLADFIVRCIENRAFGVMNACGPGGTMTNGDVVAGCLAAAKKAGGQADPSATYVPYDWLTLNGSPPGSFPILLPTTGETAGFHTRSNAKALKAGLTFRTVEDTCSALLAWWPKAVELRAKVTKQQADEAAAARRPAPKAPAADALRAGPPAKAEQELLAKWKLDSESGRDWSKELKEQEQKKGADPSEKKDEKK